MALTVSFWLILLFAIDRQSIADREEWRHVIERGLKG